MFNLLIHLIISFNYCSTQSNIPSSVKSPLLWASSLNSCKLTLPSPVWSQWWNSLCICSGSTSLSTMGQPIPSTPSSIPAQSSIPVNTNKVINVEVTITVWVQSAKCHLHSIIGILDVRTEYCWSSAALEQQLERGLNTGNGMIVDNRKWNDSITKCKPLSSPVASSSLS